MKVEKAKGEGYYLIVTDEEYEKLRPFLNRYGMLDKNPEIEKRWREQSIPSDTDGSKEVRRQE